MTADSSSPLTERERRTLDALAVGLAASDPSFVTAMRTGRARRRDGSGRLERAPHGGRLLGLLLVRVAMLLGSCVLAGAVSIGVLLLGPLAILTLGPVVLVVAGVVTLLRSRGGRP